MTLVTCDTHALIFWALTPDRLGLRAAEALVPGRCACADIVLWEIGLLAAKGRIQLPVSTEVFLQDLVLGLALKVLPITPRIASLTQDCRFSHGDPADRLIAATAIDHGWPLVSKDELLAKVDGLKLIWG